MRSALKEARKYSGGLLIDVGCGLRQYEDIFTGYVKHYVGIDWPAAKDSAAPDVIADALRLPLADSCADTILATELMEHLSCPDVFLSEAARVLRPGGRLICSVPFMEPVHEEPRDYFRFTSFGVEALLEMCGLSLAQKWNKGGWWSVTLGSFTSQALYGLLNPSSNLGTRKYNPVRMVLSLPLCAAAQLLAYWLDKVFKSGRYTLGYVIAATRTSSMGQGVRP
jgi:SAM-dependent methyltransferase